jgi:hypothetical protein
MTMYRRCVMPGAGTGSHLQPLSPTPVQEKIMPITREELEEVEFPFENWPEQLPEPGPDTISMRELEGSEELYRYSASADGHDVAMEVVLDRSTVPDPAEGVSFMLNQFAYLWRTNRDQIAVAPDGSCRRINF